MGPAAFMSIFLIEIASCGEPIRSEVIGRVFQEAQRKTGASSIDAAMIDRLTDNLPWFAKIPYNRYIKPKGGASYVVQRCGNTNGLITETSARQNIDTCISKCFFARVLTKFLDWGYADYYPS